MEISRRCLLEAAAAASAARQFAAKEPGILHVTPERFGAKGDGRANDTAAFARMASFINSQAGGVVELRQTTYAVGRQTRAPGTQYSFAPAPIMDFIGGSGPLAIRGNGARLRCADGLRFGTFDPLTGTATQHSLPYYGTGEQASPYVAIIGVENWGGPINIDDVELDGNLGRLLIGGPWGDTGRQIPAYGVRLVNNTGAEKLTRVYSHHHALDGLLIDGSANRSDSSELYEVICDSNVRQGCSIVGGRNYWFQKCRFSRTGKAGLESAPGAGVDIEAGPRPVRKLRFSDCSFVDNSGVGMLAGSGDGADAVFERCTFIGTTSWSTWPSLPRLRFYGCTFVGSIVNAFGSADPELAAQFHNCRFLDDPKRSPSGRVYNPGHTIADLGYGRNMLFNQCRFELIHDLVLPWSTGAIYRNCSMRQVSPNIAYPRGTYTGTNHIIGNVDLNGSKIMGNVTVNGRNVAPT